MSFRTLGFTSGGRSQIANKPRSYLFVDGNYLLQFASAFADRNLPDMQPIDFLDCSRIGKDHERSFFLPQLYLGVD